MSVSSVDEFHDDALASSSSAYESDESSSNSGASDSAGDENDDTIFISSRSHIVISPRKIKRSAWRQFEKTMGTKAARQKTAEQLGVDAFVERMHETDTTRTRSKDKDNKTSHGTSSRRKLIQNTTTTPTATKSARSSDAAGTSSKRSSRRAASGKPTLDKELFKRTRNPTAAAKGRNDSSRDARGRTAKKYSSSEDDDGQSDFSGSAESGQQHDVIDCGDHHEDDESESSGEDEGDVHVNPKRSRASKKPSASSPRHGTKQTAMATRPAKETTRQIKQQKNKRSKEATETATTAPKSSSSPSAAPSSKTKKPTSFLSDGTNDGFGDGGSFSPIAPLVPSPKEEMEELKQTLKKLASHDAAPAASPLLPAAATQVADPANPYEAVRVAHGLASTTTSADQVRLGEFVSQPFHGNGILKSGGTSNGNARHASFDSAALHAKLHAQQNDPRFTSRSKSMTSNGSSSEFDVPGGGYPSGGNARSSGSINKKLFGQMPHSSIPASFTPNANPPYGASSSSMMMMGSSHSQGSRAVLSALKALQDKIRRLEEERETLMQQLSDAKVSARKVQ